MVMIPGHIAQKGKSDIMNRLFETKNSKSIKANQTINYGNGIGGMYMMFALEMERQQKEKRELESK